MLRGFVCVHCRCVTESVGAATTTVLVRIVCRTPFFVVLEVMPADNEAVAAYVDYYIENLAQLAEATQFIPLNDDQYSETQSALEGLGG